MFLIQAAQPRMEASRLGWRRLAQLSPDVARVHRQAIIGLGSKINFQSRPTQTLQGFKGGSAVTIKD
jgi:hypothetical protein